MPDLAEQIRLYIDETAGPRRAESGVSPAAGATLVQLERQPTGPRVGRTKILVAALILLVAGLSAVVVVNLAGNPAESDLITDPTPDPDSDRPSPRPSGARGTTLAWEMGAVPEDSADLPQLLGDGKNLYWIGNRIHMSTDGSTWTAVDFEEGAEPVLEGMYPVQDAWAGQIIITPTNDSVIDEIPVQIFGIDGSIRSSTLALPGGDSGDGPPVGVHDVTATIGPRGAMVTAVGVAGLRLAWWSADGVDWTPVHDAEPFDTARPGYLQVEATASGFVALEQGVRAWSSSDGLEWALVDGEAAPVDGSRLLAWEAGALVAGTESGFTSITPEGAVPLIPEAARPSVFTNSIGAGQAGIAYLVALEPEGSAFDLVYSPDGAVWERQQPPVEDGELYCCYLDAWGVEVGSETVAVLARSDTGFELWLGSPVAGEQQ